MGNQVPMSPLGSCHLIDTADYGHFEANRCMDSTTLPK